MLLGEGSLPFVGVVAEAATIVATRGEGDLLIRALILGIFLGGVLSVLKIGEMCGAAELLPLS